MISPFDNIKLFFSHNLFPFELLENNLTWLVYVTEQHFVSIFFIRLWSVRKLPALQVDCWLINKNVIFLLSSLHFCLPFGFVFIRMRSILCIKKQRINEWRISKRSVVLLRKQAMSGRKHAYDLKHILINQHHQSVYHPFCCHVNNAFQAFSLSIIITLLGYAEWLNSKFLYPTHFFYIWKKNKYIYISKYMKIILSCPAAEPENLYIKFDSKLHWI